tara:strand:+ start:156 stop:260 length:105 start_codon:yes stop_codon:yes gene_type:complete
MDDKDINSDQAQLDVEDNNGSMEANQGLGEIHGG